MTAEEKNHAEYAIDKVLAGDYKMEKRMMLQATIAKDQERIEGILALNDICITRGLLYKILEFNIYVNEEYVDIAITPISAHTLTSRSIVVSADDVVTVEINPREEADFTVSADGQDAWTLTGKKVVQVKRAKEYASIIKTNPQSFYDVLRQKLSR